MDLSSLRFAERAIRQFKAVGVALTREEGVSGGMFAVGTLIGAIRLSGVARLCTFRVVCISGGECGPVGQFSRWHRARTKTKKDRQGHSQRTDGQSKVLHISAV